MTIHKKNAHTLTHSLGILHYSITLYSATCFGRQDTIIRQSGKATEHKTKLVAFEYS